MRYCRSFILLLFFICTLHTSAQDIELFQQFNGRYDYTAIGNTLNPFENNLDFSFCFPLESSSADLNLSADATVVAAYLYWAGSGFGDQEVTLNGTNILAEDIYTVDYTEPFNETLTYFSCYAEITDLILSSGNITYTFSDLDITTDLTTMPGFCNNRTNFAGWSIYVIYEYDNLPLNQLNLYQGLEIINRNNQEKIISIDNLNVIDNVGAKIGFLAWEGDNNLNFGESLSINDNILSNPPLNLADNAFNGTNTFTNSNTFYNCDLDVYNIQDNINIGDTSAEIKLTTGDFDEFGVFRADLIILNNIVTVLNSQLPDAQITIDNYLVNCGDRTLSIEFTVLNTNSTDELPANTPIAFYANGELVGQTETINNIPIDGMESQTITVSIPETISDIFLLVASVDDDGNGISTVIEINETNNSSEILIELLVIPPILELPDQIACNEGFNSATFNLIDLFNQSVSVSSDLIFYNSLLDLESNENAIIDPQFYVNFSNPETIYVRVDNPPCYEIYEFSISVENCPPYIPEGFSPNNDGSNDWFNIQGLYDVFEDHELKIYNRYGTLIFEGDNDTKWNGRINRGINNKGNLVPVGTYFYVLFPNDPNYDSQIGWVYVNY